jgi:hypothetical protein
MTFIVIVPTQFSGSIARITAGGLVDLVGIEPTTSSMPWKRAPSCATGPQLREGLRPDFQQVGCSDPTQFSPTT